MADIIYRAGHGDEAFLPLDIEVDRWRAAGLECRLWLRDDDLIADSDNFQKLIALMRKYDTQVMCSIIPATLDTGFARTLLADEHVIYVQHGYAHKNHEPQGQEKSEFGLARPLAKRIADIRAGFYKLDQALGDNFCKVFVPPWNHIADELVPILRVMGYCGLSRHGLQRYPTTAESIHQFNTHVDITNWGAPESQRARPLEAVILDLSRILAAKRTSSGNLQEAIGILLHHRVMNPDSWIVLERLLQYCKSLLYKPVTIWPI